MSQQEVRLNPEGPGQVVLPPVDPMVARQLREAGNRKDQLAKITIANPACMLAWAMLGDRLESESEGPVSTIAAYACFRAGYHRGLDALRQNGWRGSQLVRWTDRPNQGFLLCLEGLGRMAARIGENEEKLRCAQFLHQLDPDRYPPEP